MEPDVRFSLANERTYLAWVRTALALIAGGVGLHSVGVPANGALRAALELLLVTFGGLMAVAAWFRRRQVDRAIRAGEPYPPAPLVALLSLVVAAVALLLVVGLMW